jgi:hypothetical protein
LFFFNFRSNLFFWGRTGLDIYCQWSECMQRMIVGLFKTTGQNINAKTNLFEAPPTLEEADAILGNVEAPAAVLV